MRNVPSLVTIGVMISANAAFAAKSVTLPERKPVRLRSYAVLDTLARKETSGIVKSRTYEDLFWVHNDSGDRPGLYTVHADGTMYPSNRYGAKTGTALPDAVNFDWEDITADDTGNLIIADFGNNCQCRNDLLFYIINEPDPSQERTAVKRRIFFRYPDQKQIPAPKDDINFDAEGVFYANGEVHVLSKNRGNTLTKLYRLDSAKPFVVNELTLIDTFDIGGKVTGADATPDGTRLAVLTYKAVWLFEAAEPGAWFDGGVSWLPYRGPEQAEAVCFDGEENLIITDEKGGSMYRVALEDLLGVREKPAAAGRAGAGDPHAASRRRWFHTWYERSTVTPPFSFKTTRPTSVRHCNPMRPAIVVTIRPIAIRGVAGSCSSGWSTVPPLPWASTNIASAGARRRLHWSPSRWCLWRDSTPAGAGWARWSTARSTSR